MLKRCGNKLFWMGRLLERSEYVTQYLKVCYVSLMDLPRTQQKEEVLELALHVANAHAGYFSEHAQLKASDVLSYVSLAEANPDSVVAGVTRMRELASGVRESLSPELWEYTNCFYHALNGYTPARLNKEGFQSFARKVEANSCQIKGHLQDNMVRNETWMLLSLGRCMERALLLNQTLLHQLQAIAGQENPDQAGLPASRHLVLLLESIGAYGTYKQVYHQNANLADALHFLLINREFPKSLLHNLTCIHTMLKETTCFLPEEKHALASGSQELLALCQAFTPGKPAASTINFLEKTESYLQELAGQLDQTYLAV
ncbi:hypothetical protein GCM10027443_33080 [Pontibacter brevis]